jgi:hypothetical protein
VRLFDVRDPTRPKALGRAPTAEARGLDLAFPHLYVADGPAGVKVFEVSDPARPDFIAHLDLNLDPAVADDACAVRTLFQYSRPDDGRGRRTRARRIAAIAGGAQGPFLFDVTEPTRAERLFPPVDRSARGQTASPGREAARFLDVRVFARFDLGSVGGEIPTEEHDYASFAVQSADLAMGPGFLTTLRVTDASLPKVTSNEALPDGAFGLATAAWYNPPFLQRFALVAGRNAAFVVNTSSSDKPQSLGPLFGEGLPVRGIVVEEFPLDRMVDEEGRALKDISHERSRYLSRQEFARVLGVKLAPADLVPSAATLLERFR